MNLMEALKCDFCGGRLVMDDSREFATCEMCGTKYMKTTIQQKIQEIRGSVAIEGDVSVKQADFIIRGGVIEKYNGSSTEVNIPNIVTHIGKEAFKDCKGIKTVVIPNTVKEIGDYAFQNCESLVSIIIPDSVICIGGFAFEGCRGLTSVTIQSGVTIIGFKAFCSCCNLTEITIPDSVEELRGGAFSGCTSLYKVILPLQFQNEITIGRAFSGTAFCIAFYEYKKKKHELQVKEYRAYNRKNYKCQYCGGSFRGIVNKVCSVCGKPKDY